MFIRSIVPDVVYVILLKRFNMNIKMVSSNLNFIRIILVFAKEFAQLQEIGLKTLTLKRNGENI